MKRTFVSRTVCAISGTLAFLLIASSARLHAQRGAGPAAPPPSPRAAAPVDLTGYWESFVTEDWRWRMMMPPKGSYESVTLNREARKVADAWDPAGDEAAGNQCKAYGAAAVMRLPGRVHITWDNDTTLKIETEAGTQTRLLRFSASEPPAGEPTWQGHTVARWQLPQTLPTAASAEHPTATTLKTVTTHLRAGYLRKNGVPYSANAVVTEYYTVLSEATAVTWLIVSTTVDDPQFLTEPFVTSSQFKKLADGAAWKPAACTAR